MEHIIQHIALNLAKEITEKAIKGGISDIDELASDVVNDCKQSAIAIVEVILEHMNTEIREDKRGRKNLGLVTKEKDRPRELLTELGTICYKRDYYRNKSEGEYVSLLDSVIGVRPYERIGDSVSAKSVSTAADVSYDKSSKIVTGGKVSRQTVRNHILKLNVPESQPEECKKPVKEIHVFADEDHVHMQKPRKERGKRSRIVPLVTVTEGISAESERRNRTVNPKHFIDEKFNTDKLWKSVEGYIAKAYDIEKDMNIYVHGDGGGWISKGLDSFANVEHVMDGYHLGKRMRALGKQFGRSVRQRIEHAIRIDEKIYADHVLQEMLVKETDDAAVKEIEKFGKYLLGNWEAITNRKKTGMAGSCTEPQVSHVLSTRFSRNPMGWGDEALGKLTGIRVYIKNGEEIKAEHFKPLERETRYSEYADRIISETIGEAIDWSIFDAERTDFDPASGTQIKLHGLGRINNTLFN